MMKLSKDGEYFDGGILDNAVKHGNAIYYYKNGDIYM